jgi:hypothetical protein
MGHFPVLSYVPVRGQGRPLQRSIQHCFQSGVHTICYPLAVWMSVTNLDTVQSAPVGHLLSRKPRAPCRVEVDVTMAKQTTAEWTALFESRTLQLAESDILAITFRR